MINKYMVTSLIFDGFFHLIKSCIIITTSSYVTGYEITSNHLKKSELKMSSLNEKATMSFFFVVVFPVYFIMNDTNTWLFQSKNNWSIQS
jgi:hypothetical protein